MLALLVPSTLAACSSEPAPSRIDPPANPGSMAPHLSTMGETIGMTWIETSGAVHRVRFSRFDGSRWAGARTIASGADLVANWADFPSVVADGDVLTAHYGRVVEQGSEATRVEIARSIDGGRTWRALGPLHEDRTPTEHGFVTLLPAGAGARAFWLDGRQMAGGEGPMSLRTARIGRTIGRSEILDPKTCECCGTAAATTATGPIVIYRDRSGGEVRDVWAVRQTRSGWSAPRPIHEDGWRVPGCPVNGPAIAAEGRDVAVAWFTYASSRPSVRVSFSSDAGRSFGAPIEIDGPAGRDSPVGRVGIVLDDDRSAIVAWLDGRRERATVRLRRVDPDGRQGRPRDVATTSSRRDSGFPSIVRAGRSLAIAWTDPGPPSRVHALRLPVAAVPEVRERAAPPDAGGRTPLAVGSVAPPLEATTLDGAPVALESLRGRASLVNLWATWCEPCRQELPEIGALSRRFGGLAVVGISLDPEASRADLRAFVARRRIAHTIWHDGRDAASDLLGVSVLPATFLFDRDGVVRWRQVGAIRADDPALLAAIERALAVTSPASAR